MHPKPHNDLLPRKPHCEDIQAHEEEEGYEEDYEDARKPVEKLAHVNIVTHLVVERMRKDWNQLEELILARQLNQEDFLIATM